MQNSIEDVFKLSDRVLPLFIRENTRAKRLTLRIEAGGKSLRVTIPPKTSINEVKSFVERYRGWIENRIVHLPKPQETSALKNGAFIPILGIEHRIIHQEGRGTTLIVSKSDHPHIIVYGDQAHLTRRLSDALKKHAESVIAPLVVQHAKKVGKKPASIRYKDTKSRWGSCSSQANLSFSWRIIMAPLPVVNYLVAHEVAHLIEMNHSARFWALCERLCPQSKQHQTWLKRNGQKLHAIHFT
nr:SprT family zinc-dependent metalloprotease [Bartonella tamiae]